MPYWNGSSNGSDDQNWPHPPTCQRHENVIIYIYISMHGKVIIEYMSVIFVHAFCIDNNDDIYMVIYSSTPRKWCLLSSHLWLYNLNLRCMSWVVFMKHKIYFCVFDLHFPFLDKLYIIKLTIELESDDFCTTIDIKSGMLLLSLHISPIVYAVNLKYFVVQFLICFLP